MEKSIPATTMLRGPHLPADALHESSAPCFPTVLAQHLQSCLRRLQLQALQLDGATALPEAAHMPGARLGPWPLQATGHEVPGSRRASQEEAPAAALGSTTSLAPKMAAGHRAPVQPRALDASSGSQTNLPA